MTSLSDLEPSIRMMMLNSLKEENPDHSTMAKSLAEEEELV